MGFEDGADHFDGFTPLLCIARGSTVFANGVHQVPAGGFVGGELFAEVCDRLRLTNAAGGDGLPLARPLFSGIEGAAGEQMRERLAIDAKIDDPFRADELQAECRLLGAGVLNRVEEQRHAAGDRKSVV